MRVLVDIRTNEIMALDDSKRKKIEEKLDKMGIGENAVVQLNYGKALRENPDDIRTNRN